MIDRLLTDIRVAVRQLRQAPGFTLTAVLTLALGIGSLTTVATWTNAVLYNPWPHVVAPREVRFIDATVLGNDGYSIHLDQYESLRDAGHAWKDSIAFAFTEIDLTGDRADASAQAQTVSAGLVSSNYFQFLGLRPQSGGFFAAHANARAYGSEDEVVLSDALWRERFHGDAGIVGRTISINRHPFTVAGVAPPEFAGIFGGIAEEAWIPLSGLRDLSSEPAVDPLQYYGLQGAVRLRAGVSDRAAAAELHTLARSFAAQHPNSNLGEWDLNLRDAAHFQRGLAGNIGEQLPVLLGASGLLMVLVCINIASLLGQHAARRRREVAIRTALGATPGRIAAQVVTETGMLAIAGGVAGWAASTILARGVYVLLPDFGVPVVFNLRTDWHILLFVTGVAIAVTLVCGMYPVRQSLRFSQSEALHEGGASVAGPARRTIGRSVLLGLQLGLCFIVLVGCGLLTRTAYNIVSRPTGFECNRCLTAALSLPRPEYTDERGLALQAALLDRLQAAPGVESATLTSHLPMGDEGSGNTQDFAIPGYIPQKGEAMEVVTDFEGPGFFRAMRIHLVQGREFDRQDDAGAPPVVVINEAMAQRYFPRGNALGGSIVFRKRSCRIVGIVRNYLYADPSISAPFPLLFVPLAQSYAQSVIVAIRPRTAPATVAGTLRQTVASLDRSLPVSEVRTLRAVAGDRYQMASIPAELLSVYAACSVLVALIGLYAVMAFSVIERHREFALRIALGSTREAIFRLVLRGSTATALVGLVTGGLGSIAAVRLLRAMLFGVGLSDPVSYCAAALLLLLTVFVAGLMPARRAASIEPMQALRAE
ncbi:MAG TPA: ABC transporter permease [Acidobacteriaceae bacterium]|jgi:predicted permease|nr:ABC transporter permease [Acidobacteriaceae bacterium]